MSKKINLSEITPDARNTNKHTQFGMSALNSSIEQVGIIESITVSNDNVIISGNARHEAIGQKFDSEAIVVETDGTQPIIIKRTDIKSGTKEFHKASILANTVAQKNQDIDIEMVEVIAEEFEFEIEEVFIDVEEIEDKEHTKNVKELTNMIAVTLTDEEQEIWLHTKERLGIKKDKNVIFELIKHYTNEKNIEN